MYIITGAAGQVGRMAAEELLDHVPSSEVILTTRSSEKLSDLAERGASVRFADFSDPETLPGAFAGAQRMLLLSTSSVGSRVLHHNNALQAARSEEHTSELQSRGHLVCRLLLEKKKYILIISV